MSAVLYHFPQKTKISEDILEKYAELIEKLGRVNFNLEVINEASQVKRIFSGSHNPYGIIPEQTYKKLLSFYNNPNQENWNQIKDLRIFGRMSTIEIMSTFYNEYSSEEYNLTNYPSSDIFLSCFEEYKNKTIAILNSYKEQYLKEMNEIEVKHSDILNIFNF